MPSIDEHTCLPLSATGPPPRRPDRSRVRIAAAGYKATRLYMVNGLCALVAWVLLRLVMFAFLGYLHLGLNRTKLYEVQYECFIRVGSEP